MATFEREDDIPIGIFRIDNKYVDFLPDFQRIAFFSRQLVQITTRNHALRFGANTNENLAMTNACYDTCADFAGLRQVNIKLLLVKQRLHGLVVILIKLFSLLIGIAPLGWQGLILICHLMLQLRKM